MNVNADRQFNLKNKITITNKLVCRINFTMKKRKYSLLFILSFLLQLSLIASPTDSIFTTYKDGEFTSYCKLSANVSDSISNEVTNKFVYQMCYDLDGLFKWGLKGMSLANGKDELLKFDFKSTKYDKKTSILRGTGDVIVPGIKTFPNMYIDSKVTQKKYVTGRRDVRLDLVTENPFIKKMIGVYTFIPKGKNKSAYYILESHIQFGWFFNIFITQVSYKKIMEWRLKQLVRNMKEESEKREKKTLNL